MLDQLAELAVIGAGSGRTSLADVLQACEIVRRALGAEEAYVIQATEPDFTKLGSAEAPTGYEIKQKGYWIIRRTLAGARGGLLAGLQIQDRLVVDGFALQPGLPASHVACLLATSENVSDMAVVRGPFPDGLTRAQVDFLVSACSLLAGLVSGVVDADRVGRQQKQFGAVSEMATALSQAERPDDVLPALATSVARISGSRGCCSASSTRDSTMSWRSRAASPGTATPASSSTTRSTATSRAGIATSWPPSGSWP
jgi:hypothetical protein